MQILGLILQKFITKIPSAFLKVKIVKIWLLVSQASEVVVNQAELQESCDNPLVDGTKVKKKLHIFFPLSRGRSTTMRWKFPDKKEKKTQSEFFLHFVSQFLKKNITFSF